MNVNEYISSGILEAYAAGAVTDQERREVECMSKIYPEIAAELALLQEGMEAFAQAHAVEPPLGLKEDILAAIDALDLDDDEAQETVINDVVPLPVTEAPTHEDEELKAEDFGSGLRQGFYWAAAAVLLVALISSVYREVALNGLESKLAELEQEKGTYKEQIAELNENIAHKEAMMEEMRMPESEKIMLSPMPNTNGEMVAVFWNTKNGDVMIDASSLPELSDEEQYQLWALVDGQPIDMGMVSKSTDKEEMVQKMKTTMKADAFAITIEPKGGRPVPTLEKLIVLGEV